MKSTWTRRAFTCRPLAPVLAAVLTCTAGAGLLANSPAPGSVHVWSLKHPVSFAPPAPGRAYGVVLPDASGNPSGIADFTRQVGRAPGIVTTYASWYYAPDFDAKTAANIAAAGAVPELTWLPSLAKKGGPSPLPGIIAGTYDAYLTRWATEIRTYGKLLRLRFASEMNGNWSDWGYGSHGNTPAQFVKAWRHVHDVFEKAGVKNVTWVWSPNTPDGHGIADIRPFYPGDAYVDQVGLVGYNFASVLPGIKWRSFAQEFAMGLQQVKALTRKPIVVSETGSTDKGGDKAAWIRDMFKTLGAHPEVRAFTWFDLNKETNWRVDSTPAALAAFRLGLTRYR